MSEPDEGPWLTTNEFAARLKIDPATARNWRRSGYGPLSVPFGSEHRYRLSAVIEWENGLEATAAKEQERKRQSGTAPPRVFSERIGAERKAS